jgi:hypothetical protein
MYICYVILAVAAAAFALPSPPTVFNPDGTIASSNNGKVAFMEPLTNGRKDKVVKWKGPAEKYFHESTVRFLLVLPQLHSNHAVLRHKFKHILLQKEEQ